MRSERSEEISFIYIYPVFINQLLWEITLDKVVEKVTCMYILKN